MPHKGGPWHRPPNGPLNVTNTQQPGHKPDLGDGQFGRVLWPLLQHAGTLRAWGHAGSVLLCSPNAFGSHLRKPKESRPPACGPGPGGVTAFTRAADRICHGARSCSLCAHVMAYTLKDV